MDEFDRIREISEDLTHRKEPTFTHTVQSSQPQNFANVSNNYTQTQANSTYSQSVGDSFLKSPVDRITPSSADFDSHFMEEKKFPTMKLHLIGLSVFIGILGLLIAGFVMFNSEEEDIAEIVTITAEPIIVKESPEQAGGINIPDQDKLIYNRIRSENVTTKIEKLLPEPEKPVLPQILEINTPEQETETFVKMNEVKAINPLDQIKEPIKETTPEKPVLPTKVNEVATPVPTAKQEQLPLTKETVKEVKKAEKEKATTSVKKGEWRVQLFASNKKDAVEKAWQTILKKHKNLLSDMSYEIEAGEVKGKGTFYRLKVGQFASRDMASGLCAKLKAKKQDCVPSK